MRKIFLLLITLLTMNIAYSQASVKKVKPVKANAYVNIHMDIIYLNKDSYDLLDQNNKNHYDVKDITIYNMIKGEKIKVNKPHMDYPNNHFIFKDATTNTNYLRVFLESEKVLVQLDDKTTDTVKCTIKKTKGYTHIEKVWYNDSLYYKFGTDIPQIITIVK